MTTQLDARYGRTRSRSRRDRWLLVALGVFIAAVFAAWLVWTGVDGAAPGVAADDTAHTIVDDHTVNVSFTVTMPAGTTAACAVQALNEDFAVVGWKIVDIPASASLTRSFTEQLRTSQPANTGLIKQCWAT